MAHFEGDIAFVFFMSFFAFVPFCFFLENYYLFFFFWYFFQICFTAGSSIRV